jgi:deoxyribose-phosphate aldolase
MKSIDDKQMAAVIDHSLLIPTATGEQVERLCDEAMEFSFHAVCLNSRWISMAADRLHSSGVKVACVAGFPLGSESTQIKVSQAKDAIFEGADEIDMVADLAALVEGDSKYLLGQLRSVVKVCKAMRPPVLLKVIIESAALTVDQKRFACRVAQMADVDYLRPAPDSILPEARRWKTFNCSRPRPPAAGSRPRAASRLPSGHSICSKQARTGSAHPTGSRSSSNCGPKPPHDG